jgi:hypothetical protein
MERAEQRCQCTDGLCGSRHSDSSLWCDRTTEHDRLIAAPLELTLSPVAAAAVPVEQLRAWCVPCYRKALTRQRAAARELEQQTADEPLALF